MIMVDDSLARANHVDNSKLQQAALRACFQLQIDELQRQKLLEKPLARIRYMIAFTPRSGSTYLCNLIAKTSQLGKPAEYMNQKFLPSYLTKIPSLTPDEYLMNVLRHYRTKRVAGMKASWLQFRDMYSILECSEMLAGFQFIFLFRRDWAEQAVSLYRATNSKVFDTRNYSKDERRTLMADLVYDFKKIDYWARHIQLQEIGWRNFFAANSLFPLVITYEEIDQDARTVLERIASYLKIRIDFSEFNLSSVYEKLADRESVEWAARYRLEKDSLLRSGIVTPNSQTPIEREGLGSLTRSIRLFRTMRGQLRRLKSWG
jgi:trehalose 2-sulfotransferase